MKVINDSPDTKTELHAIHRVSRSDPLCPHVIRVYDFWFHNDLENGISRTFIKMEKCNGTLEQYLVYRNEIGAEIQPLELTEIMIEILDGLCHCHDHRLCHRDLKTHNSTTLTSLH